MVFRLTQAFRQGSWRQPSPKRFKSCKAEGTETRGALGLAGPQAYLFGKFQVTKRLCLKKQGRQHLGLNIQS